MCIVSMCTQMWEPTEARRELRSLGAGVIGGREPPTVGAGVQTQILCKGREHY